MKTTLIMSAVLALVAGTLAAVWLYDWRWLVTGVGAFFVLGTASGFAKGRTS